MPKRGESGIVLRVATSKDLSSNTSLAIIASKAGTTANGTTATTTTVTWTPTLGTTTLTGTDVGTMAANTWVKYSMTAADLDRVGTYTIYVKYTNTGSTPDDIWIGDAGTFTVTAPG